MKGPKSRHVLRTALISALAISVISATAIFCGASAAETVLPSDIAEIAVSDGDTVVLTPEAIVETSQTKSPASKSNVQRPAKEIEGESQTVETSDDLGIVVSKKATKRLLISTSFLATNYVTDFAGELDTDLAGVFYDQFVANYVNIRSNAACV